MLFTSYSDIHFLEGVMNARGEKKDPCYRVSV